MGLDASVMCNCLKDGIVIIPDAFKAILEIDMDGYPSLSTGISENDQTYNHFDRWLSDCCPHKDMEIACQRIANGYSLHIFQDVLNEHNSTNSFDTLLQEISDSNGGISPATTAQQMIQELKIFGDLKNYGEKQVLINTQTAEIIWEYIPQYQGIMIMSGKEKLNLGLDDSGFFIHKSNGKPLFQSNRFTQTLSNRAVTEKHGLAKVKYKDEATGKTVTCNTAISGKQIKWPDGNWKNKEEQHRFEYPNAFHTKIVERESGEFNAIIEALKTICEAAVNTGNPIRWA